MILVFKHKKVGDLAYVSHIDALRILQRIVKRTGFPVRYSQGYIPHMLTYFAQPLALGVASYAEYLVVDTDEFDTANALKTYNQSSPSGMKAEWVKVVEKNPNLARFVTACDYIVPFLPDKKRQLEIEGLAKMDNLVIEFSHKGERITKDIADKIFDLHFDEGNLKMRLGAGNNNLRPDVLIEYLNNNFSTSISKAEVVRVAQLVEKTGKFINVDEII